MFNTEIKQNTELQKMQERFHDFVTREVEPKDLAKLFRQYNFLITRLMLEDLNNDIRTTWLDDAHYYLNGIAEILDPYLSTKN